MLFKLSVEVGSYELAYVIENRLNVYHSEDNFFYIECSWKEIEDFKLQHMVEVSERDMTNLSKVEKPTSVMGRWAFHLALKSKI